MQPKRGELVSVAEVFSNLDEPVKAIREALAPGAAPLHPLRPGERTGRGQRSGPRSRIYGANDGAVQPAAHQPRQTASVQARQRSLHAHYDGHWGSQAPLR